MANRRSLSITTALKEHFTDTWKLLSETTAFLARTEQFAQYEDQLRAWRQSLQSNPTDVDLSRSIREEVVDLRRTLRLQGYDLSLASQELIFEGFRNDACLKDGFRRLVLFFGERDIHYLPGEDNHVVLAEFLENALCAAGGDRIRGRHYLWYARRGRDLVLSGSDTEEKEDFERLLMIGESRKLEILAKLKGLR